MELYQGVPNVATAAYDLHEENPYCGIPTHANEKLPTANTLKDKPSQFAKWGITAYVNEITDPGIPVYYYVYDPDHPDEPPTIPDTPFYYTPKDGTTTFTPSTDTGLPADCTVVAMESHTVNDGTREDKQYPALAKSTPSDVMGSTPKDNLPYTRDDNGKVTITSYDPF